MTFPQSDSSRNQDDVELHVSAPSKIVVPKKKRGAYTLIEFVIRITNHTSNSIRFNLYNTLIPEILDSDRKAWSRSYYRHLYKTPRQSHFPFVLPRSHIDIPVIGELTWQTKSFWKRRIFEKKYKQLSFRTQAEDGGFWSFRDLNVEIYQIRFNYQNDLTSSDVYNGNRNSIGQVTNLWTGEVFTPFTNFNLAID